MWCAKQNKPGIEAQHLMYLNGKKGKKAQEQQQIEAQHLMYLNENWMHLKQ